MAAREQTDGESPSGDPAPPSVRIVEEIARLEGVDSVDLSPPLYEVLDPEALDGMVEDDDDTGGRITFGYAGYRVAVDADGGIDVTEFGPEDH
ncbi:hypothetical protein BRC83_05410 [Halobacteriales archaeon QS_1_68_17]|nr:MAG: hypothetical protein BRC83_05410 [Halobacteriales archaeon QS_1_68_17]